MTLCHNEPYIHVLMNNSLGTKLSTKPNKTTKFTKALVNRVVLRAPLVSKLSKNLYRHAGNLPYLVAMTAEVFYHMDVTIHVFRAV